MSKLIRIGKHSIGDKQPCFIVAEIGVNHNGDRNIGEALIQQASNCGVSAVKFQSFLAEELATPNQPLPKYCLDTGETSQFTLLKSLELSDADHLYYQRIAKKHGVTFLSTPFDEISLRKLNEIGVPAIKVGSGELTHLPLLKAVGSLGLPVILSTGMSYLWEIEKALYSLTSSGANEIVLLHCVSCYPSSPSQMNLGAMEQLKTEFGYPVGLSDHTTGLEVSIAAVALGACLIERHVTMNKKLPGPDHKMSLDMEQLKELVRSIRSVESSMQPSRKTVIAEEHEIRNICRRVLVAGEPLKKGDTIGRHNIKVKRAIGHIHPEELENLIGRKVGVPLEKDTPLSLSHLGEES